MNKTDDALHASIASALIQANLSFSTEVGLTVEQVLVRAYHVQFGLQRGGTSYVTAYQSGTVLVAMTPIHLAAARRHELGDGLARRLPMVRLLPHPEPEPVDHAWVESAVPAVPGLPLPPWLVIAPFRVVAAAIDVLRELAGNDEVVAPVEGGQELPVPFFTPDGGALGSTVPASSARGE
jgi:hypothetical protein